MMTLPGWTLVSLLVFVLCATCGNALGEELSAHAPVRQKVLLLHSYAPPMEWVSTITATLEQELEPLQPNLDFRREYMDTKRHFSPEYLESFRQTLVLKYSQTQFDLIIASDNNAFDFLLAHRKDLFPDTPVVFCGVNGYDPAWLIGEKDFTGVAEVYAPRQTVDLMLKLHPQTHEVFIINDYLTTGRQVQMVMEQELKDQFPNITFRYNQNQPLPDLLGEIRKLKSGQLMLIGVYYADSTGQHSTFQHMGELLTQASAVPTYCQLDFNLGAGTVGGRVTGAAVQGHAAGKIARDLLMRESISDLPEPNTDAFRWAFDYDALNRWHIDRADLPEGYLEINRPVTFFSQHRGLVLGAASILVFLLVVICILTVNIGRRRRAELAVLEREEDLVTTLHSIGDGVIATDERGCITRLNPIAENLLGWTLSEVRGQKLEQVFKLRPAATAPPGPKVDLSFERVLKSGETVTIAQGTILENRYGEEILIADSGAPILSGDGKTRGVVIVFRDVTEQLALEQQLQQAQKMESVGQLAGGIAHDFNNMLTGIMGYAEMLQADLQEQPDLLDSATSILQAGERASGLTRKLLDFSRKGKMLSTPIGYA